MEPQKHPTSAKKSRERRHISLLEVLLVITVLSIALGALGVKGLSALRAHRFEAAVNEVVSKLDLAQHLMLCCRADVKLRIEQEESRCILRLVTDDDLPESFAAAIATQHILKGIDHMAFNRQEEQAIELQFSQAAERKMPCGVLTLASSDDHSVHIPLPGHFSQITKVYGDFADPPELTPPQLPQEVAQAVHPAA